MQNITKIYERNACQVHLKYTWLRERFLQVRYLTYGWLFYKVHRFLNSKTNEFFLELGVLFLLTKNATVMLLIVLAEAALR
jgi:hypothetical protein